MPNDYFKFKQFTIHQSGCAMKVGTDGVLLGAWAAVSEGNALDIGCGSGLITIMLAQRSKADVLGIDIESGAAAQALDNAAASPWKERIAIEKVSLQDFIGLAKPKQFDTIVCNPPYFENSKETPKHDRTLARHAVQLSRTDLLRSVDYLLKDDGVFSLIIPSNQVKSFIEQAGNSRLFASRICCVVPRPGKKTKRCLLEFQKTKVPLVEDELIVELDKRHHYSEGYKKLTKDFYLAF